MSTEPFVPNVVTPVVHINGSSAQDLLDRREAVWDALSEVSDALAKMSPNGRDYYPAGPEAFEAANAQHCRRLKMVRQLMDEMTAEMEHIVTVSGR